MSTPTFYYNNQFLKDILSLLKLKVKDFALLVGVEGSTISRIINGYYQTTFKTAVFDKIEKALKKLHVTNIEDFYQPEKSFVIETREKGTVVMAEYFKISCDPFPPLSNETTSSVDLWLNDEYAAIVERIKIAVYGHEFITVIGEVGAGKSTIYRAIFQQLSDDPNVIISTVPSFATKHLTDKYLCELIIEDLGKQKVPLTIHRKAQALNSVLEDLSSKNINPVLIFDEAQRISDETLKDIRLISEEWKTSGKPISFILFAKPELKIRLRKGNMKEVFKRLPQIDIHGFHAAAKSDVRDYIDHKLKIVGGNIDTIFHPEAVNFIAEKSRTPLDVNLLCRAGMIAAAKVGDSQVNKDHILSGISE